MESFLKNIKNKKILLLLISILMLFSMIMFYNLGMTIEVKNKEYNEMIEKTGGKRFNYISLNNVDTSQDYLNELSSYNEQGITLVKYLQDDLLMKKEDVKSSEFIEPTQTDDPNFNTNPEVKVKSLSIDYNMYNRYPIEVSEGRNFNEKDFKKYSTDNMTIPVLLGEDYQDNYKIGDQFLGKIYQYKIKNPFNVLGNSNMVYGGIVENSSNEGESSLPGGLINVNFKVIGFIKKDEEYPGYYGTSDGFGSLSNKIVYPYYLKEDVLTEADKVKYENLEFVYPDFSTNMIKDSEYNKENDKILQDMNSKYSNKLILEDTTGDVENELEFIQQDIFQYKILFLLSFSLLVIIICIISFKELETRQKEYIIKIYLGSKKNIVFYQHFMFLLVSLIITIIMLFMYILLSFSEININIILINILLYLTLLLIISSIVFIKFLRTSINKLLRGQND